MMRFFFFLNIRKYAKKYKKVVYEELDVTVEVQIYQSYCFLYVLNVLAY